MNNLMINENDEKLINIDPIEILDVPFAQLNRAEVMTFLAKRIHDNVFTHVVTGNPIMVMNAKKNRHYMSVMKEADLVVPDGMGIVWASIILGQKMPERVTGYDLMIDLLNYSCHYGWKVFLLGSYPSVLAAAIKTIKQRYPEVTIVGFHDGYFDQEQDQAVIEAINKSRADILFVARSLDKQEPWIHQHKFKLNVSVVMGVGGSFDVLAGRVKRAPVVMQKVGLEWFFRLLQEPSRFLRMLSLPRFAMAIVKTKCGSIIKNFYTK